MRTDNAKENLMTQADIWHPNADQIANANVTKLCQRLGLADYDALYRFSIEQPERYWQEIVAFCNIRWTRPADAFADFSKGREFPVWFPGGRLNWTDTIFAWAKNPATAGKTAVIAETESGDTAQVTYAELHDRVRRFAGGLREAGIGRGDRVGLLFEPGIEAVVSMIALSYIGAIVLPLFSGFGVDPVASRLETCEAKALIATSGFSRRGKWINTGAIAQEAAARVSLPILILKTAPGEDLPAPGILRWQDVAAGPLAPEEAEPMDAAETFMVFFTSGTTGKPKGIVHSHAGFPLKIVHDAVIHFDIRAEDVFFWPADMGWVAGALVIAATLMNGATMVCYDGAPDVPDWSRMSRIIERYRVTHFGAAPTMIRSFATHEAEATAGDLSSLRLLITGGEAIDPETFAWHQKVFGHGEAPLINYSGGTEASGALVASVITRPIPAGGFNTPAPGIAVDVIGESGAPCVDEVGELAVMAPFVGMTHSFWRDDALYRATYWETFPGIWVHGDLALRDAQGNFFLRGRSDDTLKLAGKRIGPAEIEDVLIELDGVAEVAAIGVQDAAKGEKLVVMVIPAADALFSEEFSARIALHAEHRLGRAFRPQCVHLVRQLPKTRTGKVMRRLIRGAYTGGRLGDLSSLENPGALDEIRAAAGLLG